MADGNEPQKKFQCSTPLIALSVVAVVVVVIGAVGAGVGIALANNGDNLNEDIAFNFDNAEFDIFEFFAICSQLEGEGVLVDDGEYGDGDGTFVGIQTCYAGHNLQCNGFFSDQPSGVNCPIQVKGNCQCDEGSINILLSENDDFACDINVEEEFFEIFFDDFGECNEIGNEFDPTELLELANIDDFTAGDLDESLDVLNDLIEECVGGQEEFNIQVIEQDQLEEELFVSCINSNILFRCGVFGYFFDIDGCTSQPGEIIEFDEVAFNFDNSVFNIFEFFAICSQLEGQGVVEQDADYYDGNSTLIGIQTCYAGHNIQCDGFVSNNPSGLNCPAQVRGNCQCGDGTINLLASEVADFACDANIGGQEQDIFEDAYEEFGQCEVLMDEFDANELLGLADINEFTAGDLDESVNVLNALIVVCVGQQELFSVDLDLEGAIFTSCVNTNMLFTCGDFGYAFNVEPCDTPPGEISMNNLT